MMKSMVLVLLLVSVAVIYASDTEEVYVSLTTLAQATAGPDQVNSYIAHFCSTTQTAIRAGKPGWYTGALADYTELKMNLSAADGERFQKPLLAFEGTFYNYDGN